MDNIRFFLIFCVVFGHFLELFDVGIWYRIIYTFHIPAFIFVTGYFARYSKRKVLSYAGMYAVFQILYTVFSARILTDEGTVNIQFTTPYWLLWYLMTVLTYYLLLKFFDYQDRFKIFIFSILIAILAGYDISIGYQFSLSRTLVFLPYFVLGYIMAHSEKGKMYINRSSEQDSKSTYMVIAKIGSALLVICAMSYICMHWEISEKILYGTHSYDVSGNGPDVRFVLMLIGFAWIFFLINMTPNVKMPVISTIGANTLPVFLLHGFIVKLADKYELLHYSYEKNLMLALALSAVIVIVFGNKWVGRLFNGICRMSLPERK